MTPSTVALLAGLFASVFANFFFLLIIWDLIEKRRAQALTLIDVNDELMAMKRKAAAQDEETAALKASGKVLITPPRTNP